MNFNRVILGGRLTRDPELRRTSGGTDLVKFGLAVNHKVKVDNEWTDRATFVDVAMFGNRASAFAKYNKKGSTVLIEGRLDLSQWKDEKTGENRSKLGVIADSWEFAGSKETSGQADNEPNDTGVKDTPF